MKSRNVKQRQQNQQRRRNFTWKERRAFHIGVGAGATVDQLISLLGSLSPEEEKSFYNGHESHKKNKK